MNIAAERPTGWDRLLATSCYLGFAPWLLVSQRRQRLFLARHYASGLNVVFLLLLLILLYIAMLGLLTYLLRSTDFIRSVDPDFAEYFGYALAVPFGLWLIIWLAGLVFALVGVARSVPPLGWMARRRSCMRAAVPANLVVWMGVLLIGGLAWHAETLARDDLGPAPVYVLVDRLGAEKAIPLTAVKLASYRLALAARERWGEGSVVVTPLTEQSLRTALTHGRLVVIWCHGAHGHIWMPEGWVGASGSPRRVYFLAEGGASDWMPVQIGEHLQFLYCSACDAGNRAELWQESLAPAEIVTFDRTSGGLEHILWVWFDGPDRVRQVH